MALYKLIVRIDMGSGAAADVATWTHGVELAALPTGAELAALWEGAVASTTYGVALRPYMPGWATRKAVEIAPAAGGAALVYQPLSGQLGTGSSPQATQAAVPLIAMVAGDRGLEAGARWMIGPMAGSTGNGRPGTQQMQAPVSYARALHAGLATYGGGLRVLRSGGLTGDPVTHLAVGNSWGTVGRRRLEVTARTLIAI